MEMDKRLIGLFLSFVAFLIWIGSRGSCVAGSMASMVKSPTSTGASGLPLIPIMCSSGLGGRAWSSRIGKSLVTQVAAAPVSTAAQSGS